MRYRVRRRGANEDWGDEVRVSIRGSGLCRTALPLDDIAQACGHDAGGFAKLHRVDLASCDLFIKLGAAPDHTGCVIDARINRLRRKRGHRVSSPA